MVVIYILSIYFDPEKWEGTGGSDKNWVDASNIPSEESYLCNLLSVVSLFMSMHKINSVFFTIDDARNWLKSSWKASHGQIDLSIVLK